MNYNTDKYQHGFIDRYKEYFDSIKNSAKNILEIGIKNGESLRLWKEFFPNANIYGLDINVNIPKENRLFLFEGDQSSEDDLNVFLKQVNVMFDVIIDDGGHTMRQQQTSLKVLYPHVKSGGFYVVEDLHTSDPKFISRSSGTHIWGADTTDISTLSVIENIINRAPIKTEFISQNDMNDIIQHTEFARIENCHKNIQSNYEYTSIISFLKRR